jgi:hypothetical protein
MNSQVLLDVNVLGGFTIKSASDFPDRIQIPILRKRHDLIGDGIEAFFHTRSSATQSATKSVFPQFAF